tara:strand:- start:633 stop:800 length:168 start_codon:yes stop_codon:yes gene_type:complete
MGKGNKKSWGRSEMYFCPMSKKVWQEKRCVNTGKITYVIHYDMPTYGLTRKQMEE